LNRGLAENEKIKVVLADIQRPFDSLKTKDEVNNWIKNVPNRDRQMADIIEQRMKSSTDCRGGLFIVGLGHAIKAKITFGQNSIVFAGAHLKERFSDRKVLQSERFSRRRESLNSSQMAEFSCM